MATAQDYEKRQGVWGRPVVVLKVKPVGIADKDMFAAITLVVKVSPTPSVYCDGLGPISSCVFIDSN
jgi:hypothetical protein